MMKDLERKSKDIRTIRPKDYYKGQRRRTVFLECNYFGSLDYFVALANLYQDQYDRNYGKTVATIMFVTIALNYLKSLFVTDNFVERLKQDGFPFEK